MKLLILLVGMCTVGCASQPKQAMNQVVCRKFQIQRDESHTEFYRQCCFMGRCSTDYERVGDP